MSGESILIVEDEALVAEELAMRLEQLGYRVSGIVDSALDAFAHAGVVKFDMALVDIHIKGRLTGIDIARRFRAESDIPVVFLTAQADQQTIAEATSAEPFGYIVKPFHCSTLAATLETAMKRRSAERRLAAMERWLHATMQSIGDAVIALDGELRVSFVNIAAEHLTGWTHPEAVGRPASEVLRIRTVRGEDIADLIGQAMQGPVVLHVDEAILSTRNGAELPINDSIAPIKDDSGRACGWVIVLRDGSARRRTESRARQMETDLEDKLRERIASLESTNQDLSAFALSIAHDLRMHLRAINGFANRLVDEHGATLPNEARRLLTKVHTSASQLGSLVEDYLRLSMPRSDGIRRQDVHMERLAQEAWATAVAGERQPPGLSMTPMPSVRGDESLLRQVWINLFSNAAKFSRFAAAPHVQVTASDGGDTVRFRVEDNGVGFDPVSRDRLFRPFAPLPAQPAFEGNGTGLRIVRRILQHHDGGLSIDASTGNGAAVEFWLPKQ